MNKHYGGYLCALGLRSDKAPGEVVPSAADVSVVRRSAGLLSMVAKFSMGMLALTFMRAVTARCSRVSALRASMILPVVRLRPEPAPAIPFSCECDLAQNWPKKRDSWRWALNQKELEALK